mgnify:CR=1 FL=1
MPHRIHQVGDYVKTILKEAQLRQSELNGDNLNTVYIGGGTPSLLNRNQLKELVNGIKALYDFSHVEEFTIEMNPDDVDDNIIETVKELGVNRVSMGVQSFRDEDLQFIKRRHTAKQAIEAVRAIQRQGVHNISIDLIYGIPGQNIDIWKNNVKIAISLDVPHISAYSLMYEKGTRLTVMRDIGKLAELSEDDVTAMYDYLVATLKEKGYVHYEVSNFALPGYCSQHNSNYWNLTPYLGLGVAAHSFDGDVRRFNAANLKQYSNTIGEGKVFAEEEHLSVYEKYDEYVMLKLRTAEGVPLTELKWRFGEKFYDFFLKKAIIMVNNGMLTLTERHIRIPEDKVMISDGIICDLLWG